MSRPWPVCFGLAPVTDDERPFYGQARIIAGLGTFALAAVLMLIDAFTTFDLDIGRLGLILGTGTVVLGVEGLRRYIER